jgi:hypothetical protein
MREIVEVSDELRKADPAVAPPSVLVALATAGPIPAG